jgi:hypothetical protein
MTSTIVTGSELRPGDTIETWWKPGRDTIVSMRPYSGTLSHLFPEGARIAEFARLWGGVTIANDGTFIKITPAI